MRGKGQVHAVEKSPLAQAFCVTRSNLKRKVCEKKKKKSSEEGKEGFAGLGAGHLDHSPTIGLGCRSDESGVCNKVRWVKRRGRSHFFISQRQRGNVWVLGGET